METSNLLDAEFKTTVISMLSELSENLNSIKKIQSDMKDTLIQIKNNLQQINSRIKSAIWNLRKKNTPNQNNKKRKNTKK